MTDAPATLTPPASAAIDPALVASVCRLAAWAGRPCVAEEAEAALRDVLAFNPDQPRDDHGRFGETGGGGESGGKASETPGDRKARRREEDKATRRELDRRLAKSGSDAAEKHLREIDRRHAAEDRDVGRSRRAEDKATGRERQREEAALSRRAVAGEERKAGRADQEYEKATEHLDDALNKLEEAEPAGTDSPRYKALERQLAPEYDRLREEHAGRERAAARAAEQWRQARVAEMHERHAAEDRTRAASRAKEDAARAERQRQERQPAEEHAVALRREARQDWERTWDAINERREAEDAARKAAGRGHKAAGAPDLTAYSPDQSRDDHGRFGEGGGGGSDAPAAGKGNGAAPADHGTRPTPPAGGWRDHAHVTEHAAKVVAAHEADPHVQKLGRVLRERQSRLESALHSFEKDRSRPIEERFKALEAARAAVKEAQDALGHESRRSFTMGFHVPGAEQARFTGSYARSTTPQAKGWETAKDYLELVSRKDAVGDQRVSVASARSRAEYHLGTIRTAKTDGPEISAHEFGHHLEETAWVRERVNEFRATRFDPKDDAPMRALAPQHGYGKDEVGNPDRMHETFKGDANKAAYAGKTYPGGRTEILSMGLEQLHRDPMHFAKTDPEYFSLVVGVLQRGPKL